MAFYLQVIFNEIGRLLFRLNQNVTTDGHQLIHYVRQIYSVIKYVPKSNDNLLSLFAM